MDSAHSQLEQQLQQIKKAKITAETDEKSISWRCAKWIAHIVSLNNNSNKLKKRK